MVSVALSGAAWGADPVKIGVISPPTGTAVLDGQQQDWRAQRALE